MAAYVAASIADTRKKPVVFVSGNEEALDTVAKITNGMMNRKLQAEGVHCGRVAEGAHFNQDENLAKLDVLKTCRIGDATMIFSAEIAKENEQKKILQSLEYAAVSLSCLDCLDHMKNHVVIVLQAQTLSPLTFASLLPHADQIVMMCSTVKSEGVSALADLIERKVKVEELHEGEVAKEEFAEEKKIVEEKKSVESAQPAVEASPKPKRERKPRERKEKKGNEKAAAEKAAAEKAAAEKPFTEATTTPANEETIDQALQSEVGTNSTAFDLPEHATEIKPMAVPDVPETVTIHQNTEDVNPIVLESEDKQGEKQEVPISAPQVETPTQPAPTTETQPTPAPEPKPKRSFWRCCCSRSKEEEPVNSTMAPLLGAENN